MIIKISTKLIIGFMLVVLLMVALALYSVSGSQKALQESVGKSSIFLAEEMLGRIDNSIYFRIEHLRARSHGLWLQKTVSESNQEFEKLDNIQEYINQKDKEWTSAPKEKITPFMQDLISSELSNDLRKEFIELYEKKYGYRIFGEVFVTNEYGANIAQTGKTSDYRQDDEEWWQIAGERGFYISDAEYDESAATCGISIGVRVDDVKGNFIGAIKAIVDITGLTKEAEITTKEYETAEIQLITKDGRIVYGTKAFKFLEDVSKKEFFEKIKGESGFFVAEEGGRQKLFSYAHSKGYRDFKGPQWMLVMRHDAEEVLKAVFILRNRIVVASLVLITMSILIAFFISRSISKPVTELRDATIEIAKGNLDTQVEVKSNNEIGQLATSFRKMTEDLKKSRDELQRWGEELERKVHEKTAELEQRSQELAQANVRLQELDRLKSMFMASMSHELRTPLNSIIGFTGIILQGMAGEITEEQRKQLTMVKNSANHLLSLINDLLDISKIEAGKIELAIEEFDLSGLMQKVKDSFKLAAAEKGLKMSLKKPERLVIKSDERRTKQVIMNLVSNAVKFTDRGEIEINVLKKDEMAEISVRDTGIGIRREYINELFKAFSQIPAEGKPKQEGTGLGLYLSKKIVDFLGGEIWAESEIGKGSVFTFTLPLVYTGEDKRKNR